MADNTTDKKKIPPRRVKKFKQSLKCELSESEVLMAGENMANAERNVTELQNELTAMKKQFNGRIEEQVAALGRYANLVRDKFEYRSTDCEMVFDYKQATVTTTRTDTGDMIESRPMTEDELQMEMDV